MSAGLRTEPIHTQIMAHHLPGPRLPRVVPVENANFASLSTDHRELEALLATRSRRSGLERIDETQRQARTALPEPLRSRIGTGFSWSRWAGGSRRSSTR